MHARNIYNQPCQKDPMSVGTKEALVLHGQSFEAIVEMHSCNSEKK